MSQLLHKSSASLPHPGLVILVIIIVISGDFDFLIRTLKMTFSRELTKQQSQGMNKNSLSAAWD